MSSGGVVPPSPSVKDKGALSADLIGQRNACFSSAEKSEATARFFCYCFRPGKPEPWT
uniref:hypothetical protein n=1 Tax=Anaplasma marginale TaxID=770 RepID=UPI0002E8005F|nr:hypothetical protein [Anaplasma marginale]